MFEAGNLAPGYCTTDCGGQLCGSKDSATSPISESVAIFDNEYFSLPYQSCDVPILELNMDISSTVTLKELNGVSDVEVVYFFSNGLFLC